MHLESAIHQIKGLLPKEKIIEKIRILTSESSNESKLNKLIENEEDAKDVLLIVFDGVPTIEEIELILKYNIDTLVFFPKKELKETENLRIANSKEITDKKSIEKDFSEILKVA